jgi:hypothetical protein
LRIVGLTGLIGSGKTTVALHLVEHHNFTRVRFAGPLKAMMAALGLSPEEIEGDLRAEPCDLLGGKTPRQAMQTLGTEWGREMIHPDLWVRAWRKQLDRQYNVIVDDVRFPNEAAAILGAGGSGTLVRLVRGGGSHLSSGARHQSEVQDFPVDFTIQNNGSIDQLVRAVEAKLDLL